MKNYKMLIQYDGTRYRGWQIQKSTDMTIQGKLTAVLSELVTHPVEVIGSGRTDAGVHALGQVANVHLDWSRSIGGELSADELRDYLNRYLPEDIAVLEVTETKDRFHSRYHCVSKTYRYRIHTSAIPNVFERKFVYNYEGGELDVGSMRRAAERLIGKHDFAAFCGNAKMKKSTERTIFSIVIEEKASELVIDFCGDGFLQNMVRILTGTLIEVGNGTKKPEEIPDILASKKRECAGYTVPPQGLVLVEAKY